MGIIYKNEVAYGNQPNLAPYRTAAEQDENDAAQNEQISDLKSAVVFYENTQEKYIFGGTFSDTTYLQESVDLAAGEYNIRVKNFESTSSGNYGVINFYDETPSLVISVPVTKNTEFYQHIILDRDVNAINFYADNSWSSSAGHTFTYTDVIISKETEIKETVNQLIISDKANSVYNTIKQEKFFGHLFIDKIYANSNAIFPCQSIYAFDAANRLGFRIVEANIHKTATNGKYIVIHGVSGKLGEQVTTLDGGDASDIVIANTSFNDLRNNYKYRSQYEKYQTSITSLDELIEICKAFNLIPLVTYVDLEELDILKKGLGYNFILNGGRRSFFNGMISISAAVNASVDAIKAELDSYGAPLFYSIPSDSVYTDAQYREIIEYAHERNIVIGFWGAYLSQTNIQKMLQLGFDYASSKNRVNDFDNGNLDTANSNISSSGFGFDQGVTYADGIFIVPNAKHLASSAQNTEPLAKSALKIRFNGTMLLKMGSNFPWTSFTSDGTKFFWFSTFYVNEVPSFIIEASEELKVLDITYTCSKC